MDDKEKQEAYLVDWFIKNGYVELKSEVKKDEKSDNQEVKIFLENGKTLYLNNVSSVKELDEKDKMVLLIKHFDEETIFRAAYTLEQEVKFREKYKPEFKK